MHLEAMSNVANYCYLGRGVKQDYDKAVCISYQSCWKLGYPNSQEVLGEMYMKGDGVEQNYTESRLLAERAVRMARGRHVGHWVTVTGRDLAWIRM